MTKTRALASFIVRHPKIVILLFTVFTLVVGYNAQNLYMEADYTKYLPQNDPALTLWNQINDEFELGSTIIIFVNQSDRRYDLQDWQVLDEMDGIYDTLYWNRISEGKETGIKDIKSLSVLIREEHSKNPVFGWNGEDKVPTGDEANGLISIYLQREIVQRAEGTYYTNDYKYAVIIIQLEKNADYDSVLTRVQDVVEKEGNKETTMAITGTIAMQRAIQQANMRNMSIIFVFSIIFVSAILFYFHRSVKAIVIGFVPPAFALVLTFGVLGIIAPELNSISVAIVALLIGLGVDYSVHMMNRFAEEKGIEDKTKRVEKILSSTGKAILLSTVTTMIGFGSLMISSMNPMVTFGFGCAIGIFFAFLSAMILVPCFSMILKFEKTGRLPSWNRLARFAINNRKRIILVATFFAVLSAVLVPQVTSDVNYYDMAPNGVPELESMFEYSDKLGGGGNFNAFLVETNSGGLKKVEVINALYKMQEEMNAVDAKVEVFSVIDGLKEANDILEQNVLLQRLANLTDANDVIFDKVADQGIINDDYSKTLIGVSIQVGISIQKIEEIVDELNYIARNWNIPENGQVSELIGQEAVYVKVNTKLFDEQARSMIIALLLVLSVLIIIFNSSVYGILTLMPVCFVLMWEPGFLVATNISLSPVNIVVASIMIGIGIDYGVHITHRFREELSKGLSKMDATRVAIEKTGLSLVEAALTTIFGMSSIFIVGIDALSEFVIIIIFMTAMSCIAAALLLPVFFDNKFIK